MHEALKPSTRSTLDDAALISAFQERDKSLFDKLLLRHKDGLLTVFTSYDWRPPKRTLVVLGVGMLLTWVEAACKDHVPIASLLGVMAIGFIILEKSEPIAHIISLKLKKIWVFAELLLFILVGAQVNIHVAWKTGFAGITVILIGLVFRSIGTYVSLFGTNYTWKEKLFCVVSYVPKATVQAAIGAVPFAAGMASGDVILAVAVLSILLTAPLGAIGIMMLGRKVLEKDEHSNYKFRGLREKLSLPHVGERVRNKHFGTVWKVIEEKEKWVENVPSIQMRFWKEDTAGAAGKGKTTIYSFDINSSPFDQTWEILYAW